MQGVAKLSLSTISLFRHIGHSNVPVTSSFGKRCPNSRPTISYNFIHPIIQKIYEYDTISELRDFMSQ